MRWTPRTLAVAIVALVGCGPPPPTADAETERPVLLEVIAPRPAVLGSLLEVRGLGLTTVGPAPRLEIESGAAGSALERVVLDEDGDLLFEIDATTMAVFGAGTHSVAAVVAGAGVASDALRFELELADSLPVALVETPRGQVYRNEVAAVIGDGLVTETEGEVLARFRGSFAYDDGSPGASVDVLLPVLPLERGDRDRGLVVLTTDIGGLKPGTFDGTLQLESTLLSGARTESESVATTFHFNPPELFGIDPAEGALGQLLTITGAGFLGGSERPDELTLLRVAGTFTPAGGGSGEPFAADLVPAWESGTSVRLLLELELDRDRLVSSLFGYPEGEFLGQATPITVRGTEELVGSTVPFGFGLGPVRQVVFVRFLPGFYDSLGRFGLANAAPEIEDRVRERMEDIYAAWNVDFRFEEPDDFSRTAYAVVEIGGPDPNGVGLFGYDNTPGKDIGNLRLFDQVGGTNAETQSDGYPGYGGVFVESFLYWSASPDLPGNRPAGAPDADPLFDEIFLPVRAAPASRAEAVGDGDASRVSLVRRAIDALGSLIGETASHELGHSLGMAQPYGSPTVYHNDFDGDGCLMDSGGDRPLEERMALPGAAPTQFCYDHPSYLNEILSR